MLCVDKVGGQVSFAFHVDDSSQSNIVSHTLHHLGSLLRHLEEERAEDKKVHSEKHNNNENTFVGTAMTDQNMRPLLGLTAHCALINVSLLKEGFPKVL